MAQTVSQVLQSKIKYYGIILSTYSDQIWKVHLCIGRTIWYLVQWSNNRKVWHRPLLDPSTRWGAQPARGTPRHLLTGGGGQPSPRACPVPVPVALF